MNRPATSSIVKFADGETPLKLTYTQKSMGELVDAIRNAKGWTEGKRLRLVVAGRELFDKDKVSAAQAPVLHCIVHDEEPSVQQSRRTSHRSAAAHRQPSFDWMESVDPGTVLMAIFGSMLALFWATFFMCGDMFDTPALILLCSMTAVFVAPYLLPHLPRPLAFLQPACSPGQQLQQQQRYPPGYTFHEGPMGSRYAVPPRPDPHASGIRQALAEVAPF